jgi:hypothetical protein
VLVVDMFETAVADRHAKEIAREIVEHPLAIPCAFRPIMNTHSGRT